MEGYFYLMSTQDFSSFYRKSFTVARQRANFLSKIDTSNLSNSLRLRRDRLPKNYLQIVIVLLLLGVAFFAGARFAPQGSSLGSLSSLDERASAPAPIATDNLNKKFEFPLKDETGKEVAKISYVLESANLQDAFIYQGKTATAVKGRTFLILNLKITNPYTKSININARDYIRIKLNNSSEQLAPDIHNDPVEIQADSTKYTRIGLPINDTDKNITLLVGEIDGEKQTIKLSLER